MTTQAILDELDFYISQHMFLSVDDPLIVARDGILFLDAYPCSIEVRLWVIEYALCVLLINRPVEVAA